MKKDVFCTALALIMVIFLFSIIGCKKKEVPVLTTNPITDISGTSAICGGIITNDGGETVINRGVCWSNDIKPTIEDNKTSDGAGVGSFSSTLTNLEPASNYFIRAYATNSSGTGYGMVMSFTTLGQIPAATSQSATNITTTTVSLLGNINANYISTTVSFEYGTTLSYGNSVTAIQSPVTGSADSTVSAEITGLSAATIYHYRIKAENSLGITYSDDLTFTTLGQVPTATSLSATTITTTTVSLLGNINANYISTTVSFEYGTTLSYGNSVTAIQSPVTGSSDSTVSAEITELSIATIYHCRIKAENSLGITYSDDLTFTTLGQTPSVTAQTATYLETSSATLNGFVNANYLSTTVTFEYGTSAAYGSIIDADQNPVTGNTLVAVSVVIAGLTEETTYHFRIKAENSLGITYCVDQTFTTLGHAPAATTQAATYLKTSSATLNGFVNANYLSTTVTFEYGTSDAYGSTIDADQNPVTGNTLVAVSAAITELTEETTYHFRIKAENSLGIAYSDDLTFITGAPITDIEGNVYSTVEIGTQTWMAENLKTTKYNDNSDIPLVTENAAWIALTTPGYCWYDNDDGTYKNTYGALYNWYTVNTGKLCPADWHVPSDAEFTILTDFLGGISVAGGKMKEVGTDHWAGPNTGATNESGFTALPSGQRNESGDFLGIELGCVWWTSTPYNIYKPWYRSTTNEVSHIFAGYGSLNIRGFSIRCIKD